MSIFLSHKRSLLIDINIRKLGYNECRSRTANFYELNIFIVNGTQCTYFRMFIADEFKAYAEKMPEYAKLFTTYQQLMQEDEEPQEPTEEAKTTEEETKEPSSADSSKVKAE